MGKIQYLLIYTLKFFVAVLSFFFWGRIPTLAISSFSPVVPQGATKLKSYYELIGVWISCWDRFSCTRFLVTFTRSFKHKNNPSHRHNVNEQTASSHACCHHKELEWFSIDCRKQFAFVLALLCCALWLHSKVRATFSICEKWTQNQPSLCRTPDALVFSCLTPVCRYLLRVLIGWRLLRNLCLLRLAGFTTLIWNARQWANAYKHKWTGATLVHCGDMMWALLMRAIPLYPELHVLGVQNCGSKANAAR